MVLATDYILTLVFQFYVEALAPVGIITEILAYHNIAEVSPESEESAATALIFELISLLKDKYCFYRFPEKPAYF